MKVKVVYFAAARDLAEEGAEHVTIGEGASVGDLSAEVFRLHPRLRKLARSVRFSVNLELADRGARLGESDVVGVLPPVAGG